ncbi:hypothetical protein E2C01_036031 [Portunus trituberculatus]|uniref:Uncharacterized protein n=1 Tax=Portunus trituberculatus TaxID=210409 RepID=A0A5B7F4R5_PORTR|nr:hypothetical protein [Portunus trituberculatus]
MLAALCYFVTAAHEQQRGINNVVVRVPDGANRSAVQGVACGSKDREFVALPDIHYTLYVYVHGKKYQNLYYFDVSVINSTSLIPILMRRKQTYSF